MHEGCDKKLICLSFSGHVPKLCIIPLLLSSFGRRLLNTVAVFDGTVYSEVFRTRSLGSRRRVPDHLLGQEICEQGLSCLVSSSFSSWRFCVLSPTGPLFPEATLFSSSKFLPSFVSRGSARQEQWRGRDTGVKMWERPGSAGPFPEKEKPTQMPAAKRGDSQTPAQRG